MGLDGLEVLEPTPNVFELDGKGAGIVVKNDGGELLNCLASVDDDGLDCRGGEVTPITADTASDNTNTH